MNENTIRCFLASVEDGSFAEAARHLYMTRQSVSRQILNLEQELGTQLFDRDGAQLHLTAGGQAVYRGFSQMAKIYQNTREELRQLKEAESSVVNIFCPDAIEVSDCLNPIITALFNEGYQVNLSRYRPDRLSDIALQNSRNLMVLHESQAANIPKNWRSRRLRSYAMVLAAGKNSPACAVANSAQDLTEEPVILWRRIGESEAVTSKYGLEFCRANGFDAAACRIYPDMDSAHTAVECGDGVCLCMENNTLTKSPWIRTFPLPGKTTLVLAWDPDVQHQGIQRFLLLMDE